jgi:aminoglycoside phosphotransferase (APT) family kinase protein
MKQSGHGRFKVVLYDEPVDAAALIDALARTPVQAGLGRGAVRLLTLNGRTFVCRQYLHGGLFRAVTGDRFASGDRVKREAEVLRYLGEKGFPVVKPFCTIIEQRAFFRKLYLVTYLEDGSDLLKFLNGATPGARLRTIRALAGLMWELHRLGVFHPDLHIKNVLVKPGGGLVFLDFDRAERRAPTRDDAEWMLWRLDRFVEKMELQGEFRVRPVERMLFLRTFDRLSAYHLAESMQEREGVRKRRRRLGWLLESALYRRR